MSGPDSDSRTLAWVDRLGASVSFACAIHCVAMPVLLAVLPLVRLGFLSTHGFEGVMIALSFVFAITSIRGGLRHHGRPLILLPFSMAMGIMAASHLNPIKIHALLIGVGGVLLSFSHMLNHQWCRNCACSHPGETT